MDANSTGLEASLFVSWIGQEADNKRKELELLHRIESGDDHEPPRPPKRQNWVFVGIGIGLALGAVLGVMLGQFTGAARIALPVVLLTVAGGVAGGIAGAKLWERRNYRKLRKRH